MSQCSERVKHALSPPFVSSGLFSSPAPVAGAGRALRLFATRARGKGRNGRTEAILSGKRQAAPHPPLITFPTRLAQHIACRQADKTGNIYAATLTLYIARPAAQLPDCRPLPRPLSGHPSRLRTAEAPGDHQKHTNWSQIMHESPQSACFTGLHCNECIGDILLCLFLF